VPIPFNENIYKKYIINSELESKKLLARHTGFPVRPVKVNSD
jgi:hypothetical protein